MTTIPIMAKAFAVIYARFSTSRQDERSIDDQLRRCREYADRHGIQVVETYADAALSGTHTDRPYLQRLLADARRSKGRAFRVVLVDDLSRLSRNVGQFWGIVFDELAALDIVVTDVLTGMSSDNPAARQLFGVITLGNDFAVQQARARTHRGLEGRALSGHATGGRTYGYSTVFELNPPNPERPRKVVVINDARRNRVAGLLDERWDYQGDGVAVDAVYDAYRHFAEQNGFNAQVAKQTLGKDLRMRHPSWVKLRLPTGDRAYVYQGLPRSPK